MKYIGYYNNCDAMEFFADVDRLDKDVFTLYEKFLPNTEKAIRVFEAGIKRLSSLASTSRSTERIQAISFLGKRFKTPQIGKRALEIVVQATKEILSSHPAENETYLFAATDLFQGVSMPATDRWDRNWDQDSKKLMFALLTEIVSQQKKTVWRTIENQLLEVFRIQPYGPLFLDIDTGLLVPIGYLPKNDELSAYYYLAKRDLKKVASCGDSAVVALQRYITYYLTNGWEITDDVLTALIDSGNAGVEHYLLLWANRIVQRIGVKMIPLIGDSAFSSNLQEKPDAILTGFIRIADHFSERDVGCMLGDILRTYPEFGDRFYQSSVLDHDFRTHALWYAKWSPANAADHALFEAETEQWRKRLLVEQEQRIRELIGKGEYLQVAGHEGSLGAIALYQELFDLIALKKVDLCWSHLSFNEHAHKQLEKRRELVLNCCLAITRCKSELSSEHKTHRDKIRQQIEQMLAEKDELINNSLRWNDDDEDANNAGPFEDHPGVNIEYFRRQCMETELKYQKEFYERAKHLFY